MCLKVLLDLRHRWKPTRRPFSSVRHGEAIGGGDYSALATPRPAKVVRDVERVGHIGMIQKGQVAEAAKAAKAAETAEAAEATSADPLLPRSLPPSGLSAVTNTVADAANVMNPAVVNQLSRIFGGLCKDLKFPYLDNEVEPLSLPEMTLSYKRFAVFLGDEQGLAHPLRVLNDQDDFTFKDFLAVLSDLCGWDAMKPFEPELLDLSLPMSQYYINSSHNTYLAGSQLLSKTSEEQYTKVLKNNCRCIEIDVWNPRVRAPRGKRARSRRSSAAHDPSRLSSGNSPSPPTTNGLSAAAGRVTDFLVRKRTSSVGSGSPPAFCPVNVGSIEVDASSKQLLDSYSGPLARETAGDVVGSRDTAMGTSHGENIHLLEKHRKTPARISVTAPDDDDDADALSLPRSPDTATYSDNADAMDSTSTYAMNQDDRDDGDSDGLYDEPVVTHATNALQIDWTLGNIVPFRTVCRAICQSAFVDSKLPIIVSLEVHADMPNQQKMVSIMKEEWGDLLLQKPLQEYLLVQLPAPGDLERKILVKCKKALVSPSPPAEIVAIGAKTVPLGVPLLEFDAEGLPKSDQLAQATQQTSSGSVPFGRRPLISPILGDLAIYTQSVHFNNFLDRSAKSPAHIFSLSDRRIQELHATADGHVSLFTHNKRYLMRAYPHGTKHVNSSNPDPGPCWRRGVQMVALNWQTLDRAMMLNHAMFAGSPGWILKPAGYRVVASDKDEDKTPGADMSSIPSTAPSLCPVNTAIATQTLDLTIHILAGQDLPLPPGLQKKKMANANASSLSLSRTPSTSSPTNVFQPFVRCELCVESEEERCPEMPTAMAAAVAAPVAEPGTTPLKATDPTLSESTIIFKTSLLPPHAAVKEPEPAALIQQTRTGLAENPTWGKASDTLQYHVKGIVDSLSFVL